MSYLINSIEFIGSLLFFLIGLIFYIRIYNILIRRKIYISPLTFLELYEKDKTKSGILKVKRKAVYDSFEVSDMVFSYLYCYVFINNYVVRINRLTSAFKRFEDNKQLPAKIRNKLNSI